MYLSGGCQNSFLIFDTDEAEPCRFFDVQCMGIFFGRGGVGVYRVGQKKSAIVTKGEMKDRHTN